MSELTDPAGIKTFSIGFEEKSFDESSYARQVARLFGTDHHEQILTPGTMTEILPEIWDFLDEPFADASIVPTYLLSKFTRQHVTVALGGDGGDELFAGYDPFLAHRLAGLYDWVPGAFHSRVVEPLMGRLPVSTDNMSLDFRIKQFLKGIPYPAAIRNQVWLGSFSHEEQPGYLSQDFRAECNGFTPYDDITAAEQGMRFRDLTDEIVFLYSRFYLADDILTKVDRASMATSLEVRAPFLDTDFTEFVNALPSRWKLHGLTRKYILKKSLEKKLPREILYRKKKGFGIPLSKWIKEDLKSLVLDVFSPNRIRGAGIFDAKAVTRLVDEHLAGTRDNRKQIWTLLMFEMWRERYAP
jgi:asparagine synthase (glutamine-hydrolysing)